MLKKVSQKIGLRGPPPFLGDAQKNVFLWDVLPQTSELKPWIMNGSSRQGIWNEGSRYGGMATKPGWQGTWRGGSGGGKNEGIDV